jgi:glycine betaine/choline ABC-type transport system substrate-binding protein
MPLRKKKINMHMGHFLFHFLKQLNYRITLELKKPRLVAMTF